MLTTTYAKSVTSILDENVENFAIFIEKLFDISFTYVVGQVSYENAVAFSGRHSEDLK